MIPYIHTPYGNIPIFTVMITIGVLSMFASIHIILQKSDNRSSEELFIIPKVLTAMIIAYFSAAIADSIFKLRENGTFMLSGITFYGGLLGAVVSMYITLSLSNKKTQYSKKEWFNNLTIPLMIFHFCGRIGCFLAGCCYGKNTDHFISVYFPDNYIDGIFHNGLKCYPTQLFEAAAILVICIIIIKSERKFISYMTLYASARFFIEFFRGDDRGYIIKFFSPAQIISILIIISITIYCIIKKFLIYYNK